MTSDNDIFNELKRILTYFITGVNVQNNERGLWVHLWAAVVYGDDDDDHDDDDGDDDIIMVVSFLWIRHWLFSWNLNITFSKLAADWRELLVVQLR